MQGPNELQSLWFTMRSNPGIQLLEQMMHSQDFLCPIMANSDYTTIKACNSYYITCCFVIGRDTVVFNSIYLTGG